MDQAELLAYLLDVVEGQQLPYAIGGSHASMAFGEARLTNDIDVVVDLNPATVPTFCAAFPNADFYVSDQAARVAAAKGGMFNIIHPESGQKIDVIVPATDLDRTQLSRAISAPAMGGRRARFVSPEDIILKKMEYFREGGSEKHLRDIAGVSKVMGDRLDRDYIRDQAAQRGVADIWTAVLKRVGP